MAPELSLRVPRFFCGINGYKGEPQKGDKAPCVRSFWIGKHIACKLTAKDKGVFSISRLVTRKGELGIGPAERRRRKVATLRT